jgi:two-component system, chemotaxis family, chemotaxis protein CheY
MSGQARVWDADRADRFATRAEQSAVPPPHLLVIDTDNLHRMIICRTADRAGFVPAGAANLAEAAKLLQATIFDCITLDLSLGQQTGELLRHLREIDCEAPVLIVGNRDAAGCRETLHFARSLGLNVGEPVPKPVDVGMLRHAFEQVKIHRRPQHGLVAVGI